MTPAATAALAYLAGYPDGTSAAMIGDRLHQLGFIRCMGTPTNLAFAGASVLRALVRRQFVARFPSTRGAVWAMTSAGREWAARNGHCVVKR